MLCGSMCYLQRKRLDTDSQRVTPWFTVERKRKAVKSCDHFDSYVSVCRFFNAFTYNDVPQSSRTPGCSSHVAFVWQVHQATDLL